VVLAYNLPGLQSPLRMSRRTYVDVFLGKTTHWRDPAIAADNPGVMLPDLDIAVVHRADGSGTTAVLTAHLAAISPEWKDAIGVGKSVAWPSSGTFIGSKGNDGATTQIMQMPGAIGYLDYAYAANNDVAMATLENRAGRFVAPNHENTAASLGSAALPSDFRLFITDPDGPHSYPIVTYTWLLTYRRYDDPLKAKALEIFIEYGLTRGQDVARALGYAPLPQAVREQVAAAADAISPDYTITLRPRGRG
jgi:phosphate transport system substrate-binding protein